MRGGSSESLLRKRRGDCQILVRMAFMMRLGCSRVHDVVNGGVNHEVERMRDSMSKLRVTSTPANVRDNRVELP
jgi:hypothetical protein